MDVLWWCWWLLACGDPEVRLDCEEPEAGDLEGYCLWGRRDGERAALEDPRCGDSSVPEDVAHGPGGCEEPSAAVLEAEQARYEKCWQQGYDEVLASQRTTGDTGTCPEEESDAR